MEVIVDIKRTDLIKFSFAVLPRMKSTYVGISLIAMMVAALIAWKSGFPDTMIKWVVYIVISFVSGIIGLVAGTLVSLVFMLFSSKEGNGILGKHTYIISSEGLYEKTIANEGVIKWEGILELKVVGAYLLLKISDYLFHVIPKRCFLSEESFNSLFKASQDYWKSAHNTNCT